MRKIKAFHPLIKGGRHPVDQDSHCILRDGQIVMVEKGKKEGHGNCSKNE